MPNADLIVSDPNVMMGKPVVRGTRITGELILEKLAAGQTEEQILRADSRLTHEAILAALGFAREALRADVVYPHERRKGFVRAEFVTVGKWQTFN